VNNINYQSIISFSNSFRKKKSNKCCHESIELQSQFSIDCHALVKTFDAVISLFNSNMKASYERFKRQLSEICQLTYINWFNLELTGKVTASICDWQSDKWSRIFWRFNCMINDFSTGDNSGLIGGWIEGLQIKWGYARILEK